MKRLWMNSSSTRSLAVYQFDPSNDAILARISPLTSDVRWPINDRSNHVFGYVHWHETIGSISMKKWSGGKSEAVILNYRRPSKDANSFLRSISDGYSHATHGQKVGSASVLTRMNSSLLRLIYSVCVTWISRHVWIVWRANPLISDTHSRLHEQRSIVFRSKMACLFSFSLLDWGQCVNIGSSIRPTEYKREREREREGRCFICFLFHLPQERSVCGWLKWVACVFITFFPLLFLPLLSKLWSVGLDEHRRK